MIGVFSLGGAHLLFASSGVGESTLALFLNDLYE